MYQMFSEYSPILIVLFVSAFVLHEMYGHRLPSWTCKVLKRHFHPRTYHYERNKFVGICPRCGENTSSTGSGPWK